jgi:hypothetical protein
MSGKPVTERGRAFAMGSGCLLRWPVSGILPREAPVTGGVNRERSLVRRRRWPGTFAAQGGIDRDVVGMMAGS